MPLGGYRGDKGGNSDAE